jgi:hypothetical protein
MRFPLGVLVVAGKELLEIVFSEVYRIEPLGEDPSDFLLVIPLKIPNAMDVVRKA